MIAYISGKVIDISEENILILPQSGVGYNIGINALTYGKIWVQEEISLYVYHHISESNQALYGFIELEEKKIFLELIKISGIWWKVALAILSLGIDYLIASVQNNDQKSIQQIKWIGKKMSEKIILELKDKDFIKAGVIENAKTSQIQLPHNLLENIKSTLTNMWYRPRDIERALQNLPKDITSAGEALPYVIKELS